MDQELKQIVVPLGGLTPAAQEGPSWQEGDWRLRSIGYNLGAAVLISLIVAIGTTIEILQAVISPSHWPEVWRPRHAAHLPLHEWTVADGDDAAS
jgi:hypothetical protein